jgi:CheY-like chemotaxis protein
MHGRTSSISQFEGQHQTLRQIKILYAEDYNLVLDTVKQLLELENWHVEICRDGGAALMKLESRELYDAIVLDFNMPGVDGIELLKRARQLTHRRRTPIIIFTASDCENEALAAGADVFVKKPNGIRELIQIIERLLNKPESSPDTADPHSSHSH